MENYLKMLWWSLETVLSASLNKNLPYFKEASVSMLNIIFANIAKSLNLQCSKWVNWLWAGIERGNDLLFPYWSPVSILRVLILQLGELETRKTLPVSSLLYILHHLFFFFFSYYFNVCHLIANAERLHKTAEDFLVTVVKTMMRVMLSKKS